MPQPPLHIPRAPEALRQPRSRFTRALGRAYFRLSGWRVEGQLPAEPKLVAIVAPHTSNWDFPLGLCLLFAMELRASWLGKHTLFNGMFGGLLRHLGGIPVDRSAPQGLVGECVRAFGERPALLLALAPEGTRKGVSRWRTGFYQIAAGAGVPILPVAFDYATHRIHLLAPFHPTGDMDGDLRELQARLAFAQGLKARPQA